MVDKSKETLLRRIEKLEDENRFLRDQLKQSASWEAVIPEMKGLDEHMLERFFSVLPYMVTMLNKEGHILNVFGSNYTELSFEELIGAHYPVVLGKDSLASFSEKMQSLRDTDRFALDHSNTNAEGVTHYYENQFLFLCEDLILCICRDVTPKYKARQEVAELNFLLNKIIDSLPVHLFVKDVTDGMRYIVWNQYFVDTLGISAEKVVGHTDYEIFPNPEDAEHCVRSDRMLMESDEPMMECEESIVNAKGEKRIVTTRKLLTPVFPGGRQLLIGVSMDITDLKKIEHELEEAKKKAMENDASKSIFLSNMGHELRTPVNAIVGFSGLLSEVDNEEDREQYISIIESNSALLLKLVEDILDISKIEAGVMKFNDEQVNLDRLCSNLYMMHRPNACCGVDLVYEKSDPDLTVQGDPNRIMQVLTNFLSNACKFTKEGKIRYGFNKMPDGSVYVYVEDSGSGIDEAQVDRVFDRFVRLDTKVSGTGLGLAICKMIIEHMGGRIGVSSVKEKGSTFHFTIPCRQTI